MSNMAFFPFDSAISGYDDGGQPIYDRTVNSAQLADWIAHYFSNGVFVADGEPGFAVSAAGAMIVSVAPGAANLNGRFAKDTTDTSVTIPAPSASSGRTDLIALRLDLETNARNVSIVRIPGQTANYPAPDWDGVRRDATAWDLVLAKVAMPAGTQAIAGDMIKDLRLETFARSGETLPCCGIVACPLQDFSMEDLYARYRDEFVAWKNGIAAAIDSDDVAGTLVDLQSRVTALDGGSSSETSVSDLSTGLSGVFGMDLLWTNPSPPSDSANEATVYNAQDVTISGLSAYDMVGVEFLTCGIYFKKRSSSNSTADRVTHPRRNERIFCRIPAGQTGRAFGVWANGTGFSRPVTFNLTGGKVSVGDATFGKTTAPTTFSTFYTKKSNGKVGNSTPNVVLIPYRIYGIKNVG